MLLKDILQDIRLRENNENNYMPISDLKINSKEVKNGDVFIALKGENHNGNDYINEVIENGARFIISDEKSGKGIIRVSDARQAYALASRNYFGKSCQRLKIIGVTGTNGKTTTASIISQILQYSGKKVGLIGTLGTFIDGKRLATSLTTPDPYLLHKLFQQMENEGCEYAVMEVSAHAIALKKIDGIDFEIGILTNITEDHLDFFKTMERYRDTKFSFFKDSHAKCGLICIDDPLCKRLIVECKKPLLCYGTDKGTFKAENIALSFDGSSFDFVSNENRERFSIDLVGKYNVLNALAGASACKLLGIPIKDIKEGLSSLNPVAGRYNIINLGSRSVVIDYAHTPDGLENVLKNTKEVGGKRKVVVIFGCGGNRDKIKRAIMGKVACDNADEVILTSDNPRYENPYDILLDIEKGLTKNCTVIENREKAIMYALRKYKNDEIIVIAGKGAEEYQEIKGKKYPYSDYAVIEKYLKMSSDKKVKEYQNFKASMSQKENDIKNI